MKSTLVLLLALMSHADDAPANRCGPFSLQVAAAAVGKQIASTDLEPLLGSTVEESTLAELQTAARHFQLMSVGLRMKGDCPKFSYGKAAAIIPVRWPDGRRHFVSIIESRGDQVRFVDFPSPPRWIFVKSLRESLAWDGTVLVLAKDAAALNEVAPSFHPTGPRAMAFLAGGLFLWGLWFRLRRSLSRATVAEPRSHSGFTLVELVVVMAVIGVLISLVAPAIQRVRESARAIDCRSRLRQIGIALHNYADTHSDRLPPAIEPYTFFPSGTRIETNLSMQAQLLQYLDLGPLWGTIDLRETGELRPQEPPTSQFNATLLRTRVAAFECPSDAVVPGGISYRVCTGTSPGRHEVPSMGAYVGVGCCRLSAITDGLSTTAFFSERVIGDRNSQVYDAWRDVSYSAFAPSTVISPDDGMAFCSTTTAAPARHGSYAGATWLLTSELYTSYNHVLPPNSRIPDCRDGPYAISARSFHAGGVHVLMGDGAVRFVSESVHLPVWRSLASPHGAEIVSDF